MTARQIKHFLGLRGSYDKCREYTENDALPKTFYYGIGDDNDVRVTGSIGSLHNQSNHHAWVRWRDGELLDAYCLPCMEG